MLHLQSWKHSLKEMKYSYARASMQNIHAYTPGPRVLPRSQENKTKYAARCCGDFHIVMLYPKQLTAVQQRPHSLSNHVVKHGIKLSRFHFVSCMPLNYLKETYAELNVSALWPLKVDGEQAGNKLACISITVGTGSVTFSSQHNEACSVRDSEPEKRQQQVTFPKALCTFDRIHRSKHKIKVSFGTWLDCFQRFCSITSENQPPFEPCVGTEQLN